MKGKVIAAGHICLDITPVFPARMQGQSIGELMVPGKLLNVEAADIHTGGSVANTGLALKILGEDVRLLGKVGADAFGSIVQNIAAQYGADGLIVDTESSTSYSVVLAVPGIDRIFLHDPGANNTFTGKDIPEEALEDAVLFHFGYPPQMRSIYENDGAELTALFRRVKEKGISTSLDLAAVDPESPAGRADWKTILSKVLPFTDFFVPSFEEICFMIDRPRYDRLAARGGDMTEQLDIENDVLPLCRTLLAMGAKTVLIKCGTKGMVCCTGTEQALKEVGGRILLDASAWAGRTVVQPCFKAEIVRSGTGAGDTSIAAFLSAVLRGKTPEESTKLAAAEGACAVTSYDALGGLQPLEELERRIAAGWETI